MKRKLLLCAISALFAATSLAKSPTSLERLAEIEGQYKIENGCIQVQKVIQMDSMSVTEIYDIIREFITRTYNDANSVVQVDEREAGRIIAKGYSEFYIKEKFMGSAVPYHCYHIFKGEARKGRVRVTLTTNEVEYHVAATQYSAARDEKMSLMTCYPADLDNTASNYYSGYIFYYSAKSLTDLLKELEAFIEKAKVEGVSSENDW